MTDKEMMQQEPVAWRAPNWGHGDDPWVYRDADDPVVGFDGNPSPNNEPLYTAPPASKPWVGLTQKDIDIAFDDTQEGGGFDDFARAIEAKLREKNGYN